MTILERVFPLPLGSPCFTPILLFALLGGYAVSEEDEGTLDIFPMDRYFPKRKYGLLLRKKKYLSPALKAFIRTIKPTLQFTK